MRTIDPELQRRLDGGATTHCSCWLIERADGVRLGFTDHDEDVVFDGVVFSAGAAVTGGAVDQAVGLAADQGEIGGALTADAISEADIEAGLYDGATATRWLVDWREPSLRLVVFRGLIGEIARRGATFTAELLGRSALLNQPVGRAFMPTCDAILGDARCGLDLDREGLRGLAIVASAAGTRVLVEGLDGFPPGWFAHGRVLWLSGAAAGREAAILGDRLDGAARVLDLAGPQATPIAPGDRAQVEAGCDRRLETCRDKFSNLLNFRGFPHMPGDGWITAYPWAHAVNDGGPLDG